jgi:hypothetical protein
MKRVRFAPSPTRELRERTNGGRDLVTALDRDETLRRLDAAL